MLPFSFEWIWDAGHVIFMGGLWYALAILGAGMAFCILKSVVEVSKPADEGHNH